MEQQKHRGAEAPNAEQKISSIIARQREHSISLIERLLRNRDTGYKLELFGERSENTKKGYRAIFPDGRTIEHIRHMVKHGDGITIKPVIEDNGTTFLVLLYKPELAMGRWLLEFPTGVAMQTESTEDAGLRMLAKETGLAADRAKVILREMRFSPSRHDQRETVIEVSGITHGTAMHANPLVEVHFVPEDYLRPLLRMSAKTDPHSIIKDFKTYSIIAEHLLERTP